MSQKVVAHLQWRGALPARQHASQQRVQLLRLRQATLQHRVPPMPAREMMRVRTHVWLPSPAPQRSKPDLAYPTCPAELKMRNALAHPGHSKQLPCEHHVTCGQPEVAGEAQMCCHFHTWVRARLLWVHRRASAQTPLQRLPAA